MQLSHLVAALLIAALFAPAATGDPVCRPINGHFEAAAVPPPDCQAPLCTAGRVWGGLHGTYSFVLTNMLPTDPTTPTIFFFTGRSTVDVKGGDQVFGTDTGSIDVVAGGFASLVTFTGGTGDHAGATGQIRLRGTFDPAASATSGDYRGEICVP
jgi:hypothetical protein